ncbi:hypothetical protein LDY14_18590 [Acinetobacter baumannii]|uniref:hypothetical protein n=1 Tax=Acinetobacter baumannii TaxID=470 RepID=UPI001CDCED43|nr:MULTISPECIES: hypothetical protein [Acinetobacter calcoaceticus/baumannii complex]MCA4182516.1 hypothetical protein [Acinetobacter baumannii]MDO7216495.1 hypothetical protein [Acinetobacter nosocomialis]
MNNLLTASEAFAALQKGKTVLCRYAGDGTLKADKSFSTLDQMPATVFGLPNYEFCIQLETIELAGITFTKPVFLSDLEVEQEVFIVMPSCILRTKFHPENKDVMTAINRGYGQLDIDSAIDQARALSLALGLDYVRSSFDVIQDGFNDTPKKQRGKKSKAEKPSEVISAETQPTIVITEQTNVTTSEDLLVPETNEPKVDPEYQKALDALLQRVKESKTPEEVNAVYRYTRTWNDKQMEPLLLATHKRLEELEKSKAPVNEPPSLMVQIQNAPDLTTLDALEIDVAARDPQIQSRLMDFVKKRRFELENPTSTPLQEAEPDYLLGDGF